MTQETNDKPGRADKKFLIFEKEALERLQARRDLTRPMPIISLPLRLVAISGIASVFAGVAWSIFAQIPLEVTGLAVFTPEEMIRSATARIDGILRIQVAGAGNPRLTKTESNNNEIVTNFWLNESRSLKNEIDINQLSKVVAAALATNTGEYYSTVEAQQGVEEIDNLKQEKSVNNANFFYPHGTVIAKISNVHEREVLNVALRELVPINQIKRNLSATSKDTSKKFELLSIERQNQLFNNKENVKYTEELYKRMVGLYTKGYISGQTLLDKRRSLAAANSELINIKEQRLNAQISKTNELAQAVQRKYEEKEALSKLELAIIKYLDSSYLIAPSGGIHIISMNFQNGANIKNGEEIFYYTANDPKLPIDVPIFLDGKSIQQVSEGMKVLLTPQGISRAEYGGIEGKVVQVYKFPLSKDALKGILGSDALQNTILKQYNSPHVIKVSLQIQNEAYCGQIQSYRCYRWNTKKLPPQPVKLGSFADAQITTLYKRPIEFVLPALRKALGLVTENK